MASFRCSRGRLRFWRYLALGGTNFLGNSWVIRTGRRQAFCLAPRLHLGRLRGLGVVSRRRADSIISSTGRSLLYDRGSLSLEPPRTQAHRGPADGCRGGLLLVGGGSSRHLAIRLESTNRSPR